MTKTFSVNENNDIYIDGNGNLSISTGIDAVMQACAQAAKTQLGEMVLSVDQGIPNFDVVWVGVPNLIQFESAVRKAILDVVDVIEVVSFFATISENVLSYTAVIRTIYGTGEISG